jgi:hypothetical protein
VLLRIVALGISDDWIAGDAGLHGGDQSAALLQLLFADPVGQEAELADAHQTGREQVEQKAADELDCVQAEYAFAAAVGIILPNQNERGPLRQNAAGDGRLPRDGCSELDT